MENNKKDNIKEELNLQHIEFFNKSLSILEFMLDEFSREVTRCDIEFIEIPKNTIATFDFLISSILKIQKGQRLALGITEDNPENYPPQINIVEGLNENKI